MNKIFKIVWNQSTQTWTAVSELAKGYVKSSSDNTSQTTVSKLGAVFKLSALTLGLAASMPNAYAALAIENPGVTPAEAGNVTETVEANKPYVTGAKATYVNDIAIGNALARGNSVAAQSNKDTHRGSVAIGDGAIAKGGSGAIAIGADARAIDDAGAHAGTNRDGGQSVAIGSNATSGVQATAIGSDVQAVGVSSVAIGSDDLTATGFGGGVMRIAGESLDTGIPTTGTEKYRATSASGNGSVAIGALAISTGKLSSAIGGGAAANGEGSTSIGTFSKATHQGSLAAGLFAQSTNEDTIAIGTKANATAQRSSAIGYNATALAANSTAFGNSAKVEAVNSTAIGTSATVSAANSTAIGTKAKVTAIDGIALGRGAEATIIGSVALGSDSKTTEDAVPVVGSELDDGNLFGDLIFRDFAGSYPTSVVSVGNADNKRQIHHVAAGRIHIGSTDAINGSQLYATNSILNNVAVAVSNLIGGTTTVNWNGDITTTNLAKTGKTNVHDAIIAARTKVESADKSVIVTKTETKGALTYDLKVDDTKFAKTDLSNIDADGERYLYDIAKRGIFVVAGTNVKSVDRDEGDRRTNYTVNVIDKSAVVKVDPNSALTVTAGTERTVTNDFENTETLITDYTIDLSDATKANITKGVDAKDAVDNKGITFTGDAGTTGIKKLGDSVAITATGTGDITASTEATANGIVVKVDSSAIDTKIANNTANITANAANITNNKAAIDSLASNTIKLSGTTGSTDAQNLNKQGGLSFKVAGTNGITTSATGDTVTIDIANKGITGAKIADNTLDKTQIVTGNVVSKTTALTVTNGTDRLVGTEDLELSLATTTLTNNASNKVEVTAAAPDSFVTAGNVANAITTAAKAAKTVVTSDGSITVNEKKGNDGNLVYDLSINTDGFANTYLSNLEYEGKRVINKIATDAIKVIGGKNATVREDFTQGSEDGEPQLNVTTYVVESVDNSATVTAGEGLTLEMLPDNTATVENKDAYGEVTSTTETNFKNYKLGLSQATKDDIQKGVDAKTKVDTLAANTFKLAGDNDSKTDAQQLDKADGLEFNINGENGITTKAEGNKVTVGVSGTTLTQGADNNYTAGNADTVVTGGTVAAAINEVASRAITFTGEDGTVNKKLGETLNFTSGDLTADGNNYKGDNLRVEVNNDGKVVVGFKESPTFKDVTADKVSINDGPTLDNNGIAMGDKKITGLAEGTDDKDAVNVKQLKDAITAGSYIFSVSANGEAEADKDKIASGQNVRFDNTDNITVAYNKDTNTFTHTLNKEITVDKVTSKEFVVPGEGTGAKNPVSIKAEDGVGTIGLNGKDGASASIQVEKAKPNLDNQDPTNGKNDRLVYTDSDNNKQEVATMNDGLNFAGDNGNEPDNVIKKKLSEKLEILGGADKDKLTENNIGVNHKDGKLYVQLSKELTGLTSAEFKNPAGDETVINSNGVTITPVTPATGKTPVSLTKDGLNNGGNNITNVAGNLPGAKPNTDKPTDKGTLPAETDAPVETNAATVGDVLNAGWNLKENGADKDFVRPYDTVEFINGKNTKVTVEPKNNGTLNEIKVDVVGLPVTYTAADGTPVAKGSDGQYHKLDADGNPTGDIVQPNEIKTSLVNPEAAPNAAGNPVTLTNLKDNIGVGNDGNPVAQTAGNPLTKPADYNSATNGHNAATVNDVLNSGWNAYVTDATAANHKAVVNPTDKVVFKGENGVLVTADAENDKGVTTFKFEVDNKAIQANSPITYVNAAGDKLVKANDGNYYKAGDVAPNGNVIAKQDGTNPTPETPAGHKLVGNDGNVTTPSKLGNVASSLTTSPVTTNTGTQKVNDQPVVGTSGTTNLINLTGNIDPNAVATVGDLKNYGWVVNTSNNQYAQAVKNAQVVDFKGIGGVKVDGKTEGDKYIVEIGLSDAGKLAAEEMKKNPGSTTLTPTGKIEVAENPAGVVNAKNVADVINASGWHIGKETDLTDYAENNDGLLVNPGDDVKFADGKNTKVTVLTKTDETTGKDDTVVKVDVVDLPIVYTDKEGNQVASVTNPDDGTTTYYKVDPATGLPKKDDPASVVDPADIVSSLVSPKAADGKTTTTTPTALTNLAEGTKTLDGAKDENGNPLVKVGDNYYKPSDFTDGKLSPTAQAVVPTTPATDTSPYKGLADLDSTNPTNAMTVADAKKLGWVVSSDKTTGELDKAYADDVRNANEVRFVGTNLATVSGKTVDGVRVITVDVKMGEVVKSNEATVTVGGQPVDVIKVGDAYYNKADIDPTTGKPIDGANAVTPDAGTEIVNKGNGLVTGNQVADAIQKSGFTVGKAKNPPAEATYKNDDERINPEDELRFADGKNTTVSVGTVKEANADGSFKTTTTVKVDVDTAEISLNDNGSVKGEFNTPAEKDVAKKTVETLQTARDKAKADFDKAIEALANATTPEEKLAKANELNAATTTLNKADKALADASKPFNKIATVENVVDAINNSGFNLTAQGKNGSVVNPGETVDMKNTDGNISIEKSTENNDVIYNLSKDIKVDSIKAGDTTINTSGITINNGAEGNPVSLTKNGLDNGGNRITNVAKGVDPTDAVNVAQLKETVGNVNQKLGDLGNKINRNNKDLRAGIAGANAAAGLPQVYIPGKSMVAASVGTFKGENALAVGYSRASDNGKIILKLQGNANTRGDVGGSVGVGYQW